MKRFTVTLIITLALSAAVMSQDTASIAGTAKDGSGAVVPRAKVIIAKVMAEEATNEAGAFDSVRLTPGNYVVLIESMGFHRWSGKFALQPQEALKIEAELWADVRDVVVAHEALEPISIDRYTEALRALEEPLLCATPLTTGESYRFLWLRTFDEPILVRVDIPKRGRARMTLKITTGQGGYDPGKLKSKKNRSLDEKDVDYLRSVIKEVNFWTLPARIEYLNRVHLDGARWITEGVRDGKCHVVDRWSPDPGPYHGLGMTFLLSIAKMKLLYEEVY